MVQLLKYVYDKLKKAGQNKGWEILYNLSLKSDPAGHAERMIYEKYKSAVSSIGVSHVNGPCSSCQDFFASIDNIEIAWSGEYK
jgi:hypothetical protein